MYKAISSRIGEDVKSLVLWFYLSFLLDKFLQFIFDSYMWGFAAYCLAIGNIAIICGREPSAQVSSVLYLVSALSAMFSLYYFTRFNSVGLRFRTLLKLQKLLQSKILSHFSILALLTDSFPTAPKVRKLWSIF